VEQPRLYNLLVLVAVLLLAVHSIFHFPLVVDDAYITFRYALNLAEGNGISFNPGEYVEGYTNFLWLLISAGFNVLGFDAVTPIRIVGLLCAIATLILCLRYIAKTASEANRLSASLMASLILVSSGGMAYYSVSGMETILFTLCITASAVLMLERRVVLFVVVTSLAFLTRPEAALIGIFGTVYLAWDSDMDSRGEREKKTIVFPQLIKTALLFLACLLPYLLWKYFYFGSIFPNTLIAKPPTSLGGSEYIVKAMALGNLLLLPLSLWAVFNKELEHKVRVLGALYLLCIASVALTGGDWMPLDRFLVPYIGILAILLALLFDSTVGATHNLNREKWNKLKVGLVMAALMITGQSLYNSYDLHKQSASYQQLYNKNYLYFTYLSNEGVKSLGAFDIGLMGYLMMDTKILDMAGLVDKEIAKASGRHGDKQLPMGYIQVQAPEMFIINSISRPYKNSEGKLFTDPSFSVWEDLIESEWFRENYRFEYVVIVASDLWHHVYVKNTMEDAFPDFLPKEWKISQKPIMPPIAQQSGQ